MKVQFESTLEDYIDVSRRSAGPRIRLYIYSASVSLLIGGLVSVVLYLMFRDWLVTAMAASVMIAVTAATMVSLPERNIRDFLVKRLKLKAPIPTQVEITPTALISSALGQTVTQEWKLIENIEETDDAIYFRNIFGLYTAARKRGFENTEEMKAFLDLAKEYWAEAALPKPPNFDEE